MAENKQEPIDFQKIALLLWNSRKFIAKVCCVMFVVAAVYAFSLPRTYTSAVTLAPEVANSGLSGGFGALADIAGLGGDGATGDAIYPEIYPELIGSKQFLLDLFDLRVKSLDGKIDTTLYVYQLKHQKIAWWVYPTIWVKKTIKWIKGDNVNEGIGEKPHPFLLSKEEDGVSEAIKRNIVCLVDKKTGVITLRYTAQDALISTTMVDAIKDKLQEHIVEYRTCKARNDLKYFEKLCADSRAEYIKVQEAYADFCDKHIGTRLSSYGMQKNRLENEVILAQSAYSQASQQLQLTRAKLQENTPAFAVLSCASVPLKPSAPRRMFIVLGFVMLGAIGASAYVYLKDQFTK